MRTSGSLRWIDRGGFGRVRRLPDRQQHLVRRHFVAGLTGAIPGLMLASSVYAASPPPASSFPPPVSSQAVYDTAGVLRPETIARLERTIDAMEARTGSEVVVYTQVDPDVTAERALAGATALFDQWGIGQRGLDNGLVVFLDLDESRKHGQFLTVPGAGYNDFFLSQSERQAMFDLVARPYLASGDLDGALLAALARLDQAATPEAAANLFDARIGALLAIAGAFATVAGQLVAAFAARRRERRALIHPRLEQVYLALIEDVQDRLARTLDPGEATPAPIGRESYRAGLQAVGSENVRRLYARIEALGRGHDAVPADHSEAAPDSPHSELLAAQQQLHEAIRRELRNSGSFGL